MGKEFYSDAIKLMKSFGRGNQSSRTIVGRSAKGRGQGKTGIRPAQNRPPARPPARPPRRP
jgi:hypothetical protein